MTELVARAQTGDSEAFGQLYRRYAVAVHRYVFRRCPNAATADDLTSETFLRAMRRIDSFGWQGKEFTAWLFAIARNLVIDHVRSGAVARELPTSDVRDTREFAPSAEDLALAALSAIALNDVLAKLTGSQQRCLTLRFVQGYSVEETACSMGKTRGAVKTLQYRALKNLGGLIADASEH